ncbi:MAG: anti-sigma factor [Nitrospirota bacterium]
MNNLTHEEILPELGAVALDSASVEFCLLAREHAAACPECGPVLFAMEETVAHLGQLVPQQAINPGHGAGIRSRLLMRARLERESSSAAAPGPPDLARGVASLTGLGHKLTPGTQRVVDAEIRKSLPRHGARFPRISGMMFLAMAASAAFIITGAQLMRVTAERNSMREQSAQQVVRPDTTRPSVPGPSEKEALVAAMAGPDVKIVPLATGKAARMGRMFWNRASNDWTIVVYTMPPPKPGMTYQVWLVTDKSKISAGTFQPDSAGHAFMQAKYTLERNALKAVAVTEEPMGGMPSPTGPIVVSGSAAP